MLDQPNPAHHNHQLVGADAEAVDALIEAQFDLSRLPGHLHTRGTQAARLFALLDGAPAVPSRTLTDVTMARLARIGTPEGDVDAVLSPDDIEALDALVSEEFRPARVASSLRPRAERLEALGHLITGEGSGGVNQLLVERTMRAVATSRRSQGESVAARTPGGFRFADLVSVAAVLMMGVAVLWPVLSTVRGYSQRSGCATNFGGIASALSSYSADFKDQLPMAAASFGGSWLEVGGKPERSNSANLFTLTRAGYAPLAKLACDGNPMAARQAPAGAMDWASLPQVSYSYYVMFGKARPTATSSPATVILADRSPVVLRAAGKQPIPYPEENSPNHGGQGQWALRVDGSAGWLNTPQHGTDNIWLNAEQEVVWNLVRDHVHEFRKSLPKGTKGTITVEVPVPNGLLMQGNELPGSEADTLLGP